MNFKAPKPSEKSKKPKNWGPARPEKTRFFDQIWTPKKTPLSGVFDLKKPEKVAFENVDFQSPAKGSKNSVLEGIHA